jgi:hypothetical protein
MPAPDVVAAPAERLAAVAAYALVLVLTVELALWGAFLVSFRVAGVLVPVCWVIAVMGNAAVGRAGGMLAGRLGAGVPGLLWLAVVVPLMTRRTEGDLVVVGLVGLVFLAAGALASAVVCRVAPPSRWPSRWPGS